MKKILVLLFISLFTVSLAACGGGEAAKKADAMPTSGPASAPADNPAEGGGEGEGEEEEEEGEEEEGEEGADSGKKSLKKFEGNRMERAGDDDE